MSQATATQSDTTARLKSIIDRIERLETEKKGISDDISDIYKESKDHGYNVKILREVVKLRKLSYTERKERETEIDTYMAALGV